MKLLRSAARQRFGAITCGAWLGMHSRQRNRPKILCWDVSQFDTRQGKGGLGIGEKTPDGQQQDGYDDDVPNKGCRKRAAGQAAFDPLDTELRILRSVGVHGSAR